MIRCSRRYANVIWQIPVPSFNNSPLRAFGPGPTPPQTSTIHLLDQVHCLFGRGLMLIWTRCHKLLVEVRKQPLDLVHHMCILAHSEPHSVDQVQHTKLDQVQNALRPRPNVPWTRSTPLTADLHSTSHPQQQTSNPLPYPLPANLHITFTFPSSRVPSRPSLPADCTYLSSSKPPSPHPPFQQTAT